MTPENVGYKGMGWNMRRALSILSVAMIAGLITLAETVSLHAAAHAADLAFEEVAPPPEEAKAITLSTPTSPNPSPETWLKLRRPEAPTWWLGPSDQLMVRNVSQATLTPFLPESSKATGAAVILAPGGGTLVLGIHSQGYEIARWLNERGIAAFVLKYRLVPTPKALGDFLELVERRPPIVYSDIVPVKQQAAESAATHEDGLEAVRYLRAHAAQFKIAPNRIGFMGFSAGAFTATGVALEADSGGRPDFVALIYGGMGGPVKVTASAPPVFIAATSDDPLYSIGGSVDVFLTLYRGWQLAHVPAELHMFDTGGHGFGITPKGKSSDQWTALFDHWLRERGAAPAKGTGAH
jgi:acetyl esterase/lipase